MKKLLFAVSIIFLLISCHSNSTPDETVVSNKIDSFFPVTSYLKGQLLLIDSLPITPLHLTTIKDKTDSSWINKSEVKSLLQPFLNPEINMTNWSGIFKETKFNDRSLNAITFTYDRISNIKDSSTLKHWDVYVNPETGNVFKIYIVKNIQEKNNNIIQQLTWESNKWAKIVSISNNPNTPSEVLKEEKVIWDFNEN